MYVVRTYGCEECSAQFEMFQTSDEGPPKFCPQCGAEFDPDADPIPSRIAIGGSAIAKSTDLTYRQLEDSSAARAAELGAPSLKITDLRDNLREGDVAAKGPPDNVITRFDREAVAQGRKPMTAWGGGFATPGARVAAPIQGAGGNFVGPGHIALQGAQETHLQRVQDVMRSTPYAPYVKGRG